ncbi:iron ABC transporter permease [Streptomyces sp. XM4193]|uniref:FecCD family ABC transporter permease n=1 Tax=Streptomyces sp. XM4193 TaxID=2929782 RepID=UPI001FF96DF4|nr:iron ABC transporter permease [Streptomyces sp. XM4193]MCK1794861.1 iron ABC transporter permease [Streptomyces sp. XM4193]
MLTGAVLLLALGAALSLCVGAQGIEPAEVWRGLLGTADGEAGTIVREVRVPRTVLAVAVGAALAVAGALIQTLTRNPLAEPGLLGVTAGAGFAMTLGAALGLVGTEAGELALAATGALLAALLVFTVGRTSPLRLVLTGVALTAVLTGVSVGLRVTLPDVLDSYRFWSVGALAGREQADLAPLLVLIGCCLAATVPLAGSLGAIALGEHVAHTLGVRVARVRLAVLALITLLTGAATAAAGPIVFVGLVVPHLARRAAGGSVRLLIGYTMLLGPVLMLLADVGARVLLPVGELPVAVVTAFVGGPVLIWAVRRYGAVAL